MSFLHVDHVTHTYFSLKEKTTAVKDIHFQIEKGDFISFLGPSGCGKNNTPVHSGRPYHPCARPGAD